MTLSELIAKLEKLKAEHGDIDVVRLESMAVAGDFGVAFGPADMYVQTVYWQTIQWPTCHKDVALLSLEDGSYCTKSGKAVLL